MAKKYSNKKKTYWGGEDKNVTIEEPTLETNLEKTAMIGIQAVNNQVTSVLNNVAENLNVDPNASPEVLVKQFDDRLDKINKAFQSPEGQEMLKELGVLAGTLLQTASEPLKEGQRIFNKMLTDQIQSFEKIAWGAIGLVPVVGDVSEVIRLGKDLFQLFIKTMKSMTGILLISSDTFDKLTGNVSRQANLFTRMANLVQNAVSEANMDVNRVLDVASSNLRDQSKYLTEQGKQITESLRPKMELNMPAVPKIQRGGAKISRRTNKSISKFLSRGITSEKIRKKYMTKKCNKTKRCRK
jgi:hypothetical protein